MIETFKQFEYPEKRGWTTAVGRNGCTDICALTASATNKGQVSLGAVTAKKRIDMNVLIEVPNSTLREFAKWVLENVAPEEANPVITYLASADEEAPATKAPPLTVEQVKELLPNVMVMWFGNLYTGTVRGRRNLYAEVSWQPVPHGEWVFANFAWETIANVVNSGGTLQTT